MPLGIWGGPDGSWSCLGGPGRGTGHGRVQRPEPVETRPRTPVYGGTLIFVKGRGPMVGYHLKTNDGTYQLLNAEDHITAALDRKLRAGKTAEVTITGRLGPGRGGQRLSVQSVKVK